MNTSMKLYFSPLSCSLATRVALAEAGKTATFVEVDPVTKEASDGSDFRKIHPLGLVPTLCSEEGEVISENFAVLLHVAEGSSLAAPTEQRQLRQWLGFIGTEVHKLAFASLFDPSASEEVRAYALSKGKPRLDYLNAHLTDRAYLLASFSVADAYLVTVLNWAQATPVDLTQWPALQSYLQRGLARPSFQEAIAVELPLYLKERKRAAARQQAPVTVSSGGAEV